MANLRHWHYQQEMTFEKERQVLHWLPDEDRWEPISWTAWIAFRGVEDQSTALPGIAGGVHYFVVCIHDSEALHNIIPYKYMVDPDGRVGADNFGGLTKEERDDHARLSSGAQKSSEDRQRLRDILSKMEQVNYPPKGSMEALIRALPIPAMPETAAARFIRLYDEAA